MVLLAVTLSLLFLLIRIVYLAFAVCANDKRFRLLGGDVTVLLCMALLQEGFMVLLNQGVGSTLQKQCHKVVSHSQRVGGKDVKSTLENDQEVEPGKEERKGLLRRLLPILHTTTS